MANAVKLTMSERVDPDSVQASDFEIDGEDAATAVVGADIDDDPDTTQ